MRLTLAALAAFVLSACPVQREDSLTTEEVNRAPGRDATLSPLPAQTATAKPPIDRVSPSKIRRAAAEDGRIDRAEVIALVRARADGVQRVRTTLSDGAWKVKFVAGDGCHYSSVIDAVTGKGIEGQASCP